MPISGFLVSFANSVCGWLCRLACAKETNLIDQNLECYLAEVMAGTDLSKQGLI